MKHFAKSLLVSAALCAATLLPVHAEMDVISLKAAIEASVDADYPKLDGLYKDLPAHPELAFEEAKAAAATSDAPAPDIRINSGTPLPANHSPLFAPVPKPTIETGIKATTLAVLSVFDQHARGK